MSNINTVINNNPKTAGSTMFLIGALSLSFVLKLLGEAMFPPYIQVRVRGNNDYVHWNYYNPLLCII